MSEVFVKSDLLKVADRVLQEDNIEKTEDGCWEWQGAKTSKGYGTIRYNGKTHYTHRIILQSHGEGFTKEKDFACHKCDNPSCVNPDHLFAGSHQDNMNDAVEKGRMKGPGLTGENHGGAKLTKDEVIEIREKFATGEYRQKDLAKEYSISRSEISNITQKIKWKEVDGPKVSKEEAMEIRASNLPDEYEHKQGSKHHNSKLTEEEVVEIRKKYHDEGIYQKTLAKKYGTSRGNIGTIVRGENWQHAGGPTE